MSPEDLTPTPSRQWLFQMCPFPAVQVGGSGTGRTNEVRQSPSEVRPLRGRHEMFPQYSSSWRGAEDQGKLPPPSKPDLVWPVSVTNMRQALAQRITQVWGEGRHKPNTEW